MDEESSKNIDPLGRSMIFVSTMNLLCTRLYIHSSCSLQLNNLH
ncbi:hypothetical protein UT300007_05350 [Clostridium sp. CTA-7]